jgi:outer membrane protein insertion porin family
VVALSPTKRGVYLTMNLHEGHVYRVGRVFLNGRFVVPRARLEKAIRIKRGTIYSRARAKLTADLLKILMQDRGYAFARVETIPQLNRKTHVVSLDFFS